MKSRTPNSELPASVEVFDTTLRDGAQREGISYSMEDKLRIAHRLDELGVAFIEGGWPGSNPKDEAFFARATAEEWRHAKLVAFGATRRAGLKPADDPSIRALVAAGTEVCAIFGKSSPLQVEEILRTTRQENLAMIEETVAYLRAQGKRVIYDAEHFFDGYDADPFYALDTLSAAFKGGAETLVLCDTNGGHLPWQVEAAVRAAREYFGAAVRIGIHAHDDTGCGVANTVAAVRAGAAHVQGTINGYGERCGNANLCVVLPNLELKLGVKALPEGGLKHLLEVSRFVAEVANLAPDEHLAYVGHSAFAHKAGVHVSAMQRHPDAYQHVNPAQVGNVSRVVVSELSGRANLVSKAVDFGLDSLDAATGARAVEVIKARENEGFSFEAAEASVALIVRRLAPDYKAPFALLDYRVMVSRHGDHGVAEATIKLKVGDQEVHTAAEGEGPVHAFDRALRKALTPIFPQLAQVKLADYKVRILNSDSGTAAVTRVLVDWHDARGECRWSTVGAGANILEATWLALADGFEHALTVQAAAVRQEVLT
ncbi:MAG: citramalate synthase [Opitutae bacterium]|nr:citramalate synthase [Opitutae bacterium]